jgi:DNA-binding NarL/FixJ family response regulator
VGAEHPTVARVLVSGSDDPYLPAQARRAGLMGYLPKSLDPALWELALARILCGEPCFPRDAAATADAGPTGRQAVIRVRLAEGRSNKAIASERGITERTVTYHLAEIHGRLGAANRAEAVARASTRGWLRLPQSA